MGITEFRITEQRFFDMWLHQNRAEPTGAWFEGSLLDNDVYSCKRGYAFVYELGLTEWTSGYLVKFAPYEDAESLDALWREWHERESEWREWCEWNNAREGSAA